jgi:twitching motility protein PilT
MFAQLRVPEILAAGRRLNASDIHLSSGEPARFRIDGALQVLDSEPVTLAEIDALQHALIGPAQRRRLRIRGEVDAGCTLAPYGRFRVHAYRALGGAALTLRLFSNTIPEPAALGLPLSLGTQLASMRGLVLIAGRTGSGKTTALASYLNALNQEYPLHILTIEDPIEYVIPSARSRVTQREVGVDTPSFDTGIYGALRSDPDIIAIGELRDARVTQAALRAADTGHLVLATIHSHDTTGAIERIYDMFGRSNEGLRGQLASALSAVLALRMMPIEGGGRRVATELLFATDAVKSMIRDGKTHHVANAIATGRSNGMHSMESRIAEYRMAAGAGR